MLIRTRRPTDGPALAAIAAETHVTDGYPKYMPDDVEAFIVQPDALASWVAEVGAEVVGHVALHASTAPEVMDVATSATGLDEDGLAVVARLLVAPAARRQGTGRDLLDRATQHARALGRRAVLDVVDDHVRAIALYEACGWTRVGEAEWYLPDRRPLHEFVYISPEA